MTHNPPWRALAGAARSRCARLCAPFRRPSRDQLHSALQRPRHAQLRTRVLAGVLAVTVAALVAFDFAAVGALRRYLVGHTDGQLTTVLRLYRPMSITLPPGRPRFTRGIVTEVPAGQRRQPNWQRASGPTYQQAISGPRVRIPAPILEQFGVGFIARKGPREFIVSGNPALIPRLGQGALRGIAASRRAQTVASIAGDRPQLRLGAVPAPGGFLYATTSLGEVDSTVSHLELILAIASVAVGLLVAAGIGLVLRRGLRPIERMASQADRITAGDLTERVRPQDPATEVGRLGAALNGMLTRIEASVSEREASQELTRRFFADASHELRNPLASLRANAELYQQGALTRRDQVDEAMGRIAHEAQRMSALVDDMLRLARLDQHPEQCHRPVDLTALVADCTERAEITDPARTWRTHIAAGLATTGDEELLRRAIGNLLANVSAHTPAGTTATITASQTNGSIALQVSDDGPGVPPAQLARIFDRFYRSPAQAGPPGSGLGLAIVNAIAGTHHGTAEASPGSPHGLRITLTLPAAGPPAPAGAEPAPHTVSAAR